MTSVSGAGGTLIFAGYLVVFGGSALACAVSIRRTRTIPDPGTRRGIVALLATSGIWAASSVGVLLAPTRAVALGFYLLGLTVGLATVGAWLYFCSAYTGRSLHRNPTARRLAVGVFVALILVKLTNPIHGLYYTTAPATQPFPHLAIEPKLLHWVAMALSYALAFVGYFMLIERFYRIDLDTRPLVGLVAITSLPALLDVVGVQWPGLLNISYEPLGVAAFAVGVLFVYHDAFRTVQLTSDEEDPTIYLDDDRRVREFNRPASALFPALMEATGKPLEAVLPDVAAKLEAEDRILRRRREGGDRYYEVWASPFSAGETKIGELLTLSDVTETEQYRRELERTTDQLESFASVVAHDLRNPLNVAEGYTEIAREEHDGEELEAISESHDRMREIIDDLLALAREGKEIGETEPVSLADAVDDCWRGVETNGASLRVAEDVTVEADASRLNQLLENLFRNAIEHGGSDVTITVGATDGGFYVEDDGAGISADDADDIFEPGVTTATDGTGFGLAIVAEIAEGHGWDVAVGEGADGGARFEITGV